MGDLNDTCRSTIRATQTAVLMSEAYGLSSITLRHTSSYGGAFTCCVIHPRLCLDCVISLRLPPPCISDSHCKATRRLLKLPLGAQTCIKPVIFLSRITPSPLLCLYSRYACPLSPGIGLQAQHDCYCVLRAYKADVHRDQPMCGPARHVCLSP